MNKLWQQILSGAVRHLIGAGGTLMATKGYIGESDVEVLVGGVMALVAVGLSALNKIAADRD